MIYGMPVAGVLLHFLKHKRDKERTVAYDRCQLITRGHGFQYAYMALIALLMLHAGFEERVERFASPGVVPAVILLLPGLVPFAYCLFRDVYWSSRGEKKEKRALILWLATALLSFAQSLHQIMRGGFRISGRYSVTSSLPLLLDILSASMFLLQCIKYVVNRREEEQ